MDTPRKGPKILIVTPEIAFLPAKMGFPISARCGGLADVSAALVDNLSRAGVNVHVALPEYRFIFQQNAPSFDSRSHFQTAQGKGLHLVRERAFCSTDRIYSRDPAENLHRSLVFQRDVINHVIPFLQPDLIHCHDWMTGLLPAVCKLWGIPCLFTLHSEHTARCTLAQIEDCGIDAALFWQHLYYTDYPGTYDQTRNTLPIDLLASGVFAAALVNNGAGAMGNGAEIASTGSANALERELGYKRAAARLSWVLNDDTSIINPSADRDLLMTYSADTHQTGKTINKVHLQAILGLRTSPWAPLFLWPTSLLTEPVGFHRVTHLITSLVNRYRDHCLQFVLMGDGEECNRFRDMIRRNRLTKRIALNRPDKRLSKLAWAAADYLLLPTAYDTCGPMPLIGSRCGTLPVVCRTGGFYNPVENLDVTRNSGGGFLFDEFEADHLNSTVHRAIQFYHLPAAVKAQQVSRIMMQSAASISSPIFVRRHMRLYESMLGRPLRARVKNRPRPANTGRETLNIKRGWPSRSRWQVLPAAGLPPARAKAFA
jgi:starch synthase/alpha-amylase